GQGYGREPARHRMPLCPHRGRSSSRHGGSYSMSVLTSKAKGMFAPIARHHARSPSKRAQGGSVLFHAFPSGLPAARPSFYGFRQHVTGAGVLAQANNPPG